MGRLGVVLLLAVGASASACGKSPVRTDLQWYSELEPALAMASAEHKPLFVYVGAEWDAGGKELEHQTFPDGEVNQLLRSRFVLFRVDATDDDAPRTKELSERFKVLGVPTMIIFTPSGMTELKRFNQYIPPQVLVPALRWSLRPEAVREAQWAAAAAEARRAAEVARVQAEWEARRRNEPPTVTIDLAPQ